MKTGVELTLKIENGLPRLAEISMRGDKSVCVRIHQPREDCYLELWEVAELFKEMSALNGKPLGLEEEKP